MTSSSAESFRRHGTLDTLSDLRASHIEFTVLDFGGSVFDFAPVHVRSFETALAELGHPSARLSIKQSVLADMADGADSFVMAAHLIERCELSANPVELAVAKRRVVEAEMQEATLEPPIREFCLRLLEISGVAIISLGLDVSMRSVLVRSIGSELADSVSIYGRRSLEEKVGKAGLLGAALARSGVPLKVSAYCGDALIDQQIARECGVTFIRLAPF